MFKPQFIVCILNFKQNVDAIPFSYLKKEKNHYTGALDLIVYSIRS